MATLGYDSPGLLARFNLWSGRPTADAISNDTKYTYLADAEQYVLMRLSPIVAKVLYDAPTALTSTDGGFTYTFGTDEDGNALFPLGRTKIFTSLTCVPDYALQPGVDYLDEGTRIRSVNDAPLAGPLYWYGLQPIGQMSAIVDPVLQPPPMRTLIVVKAVADFAESANIRNAALADRMLVRFEREFGPQMTMIRKHLQGSQRGRWLVSSAIWASGMAA